ncbi:MAG: phospholipid carrier-dependent glycosyltransferase [Clostridiales bacterium]|nr:phospholipid carrier-dependent glycosyltransferase [Clostridiales bacterium]
MKVSGLTSLNASMRKKREAAVVALLLFFYVLLQSSTLSNDPWERMGAWRQSDTYSIALNFSQLRLNIFYPQLNYDGPSDNYVQLELQIMPFMSAMIMRLLKTATPLIPRAISLSFYLGSAVFVYLILKRFTSYLPSLFGLLVYLLLPITLLYARAIMPESCALFFLCGSIYFLLRWHLGTKNSIWLSAVFLSVAIMEKTPVIFAGILVLAVFFWKQGIKCLRSPVFYGYGLIALLLPAAYFLYSSHIARFCFVDRITLKLVFSSRILSLFTQKGFDFFRKNLPLLFTWPVLALSFFAFLFLFNKERRFLLVWLLAFMLENATIVASVRFRYYLIFLAPILSVLCGIAAQELLSWKKRSFASALLLTVLFLSRSGLRQWSDGTKISENIAWTGRLIESATRPSDIIAAGVLDPSYINAGYRKGYRANIKYYDYIPQEPKREIKYFIEHGVNYFVVAGGYIYGDDGSYYKYIRDTYPLYAENAYCKIYKLSEDQNA